MSETSKSVSGEKRIVFYCRSMLVERTNRDWSALADRLIGNGVRVSYLLDRMPPASQLPRDKPVDAIYPGDAELRGWNFPLARTFRFLADRWKLWSGVTQYWAWKIFCETRLRTLRPHVLVTFAAGFHLEEAILVERARALGVRVVVLPLSFGTVAFNQQAMITLRRDFQERLVDRSPLARQLVRFAPQFAFCDDDGASILYGTVPETVTAILMGLHARAFYCRSGDSVDLVCCPSEIDAEELEKEGVSRASLHVTGSPVFDQIHERLGAQNADALQALENFDPAARSVVINFTPLATYGLRTAEEDERILEVLLSETRARFDGNIVVSVHPGPFPEWIPRLCQRHRGAATQTVDVTILIQHAVLYLSERSTTIHFAIALGVPVIVLGFTELIRSRAIWAEIARQYREQGTRLVMSEEQFRSTLAEYLTEPEKLRMLTDEATRVAPRWALLDGKCCERIATELQRCA